MNAGVTLRIRRTRCALVLLLALLATACCRPCGPVSRAPVASAATLTAEQRVAVEWIRRARAAEPTVTSRLQAIAEVQGAELVGLEHRIKSLSSTLSKLERLVAKTPDAAPESVAVYDALRYTMVIPDEPPGHHDATLRGVLDALEQAGHEVREVKNYWPRGDSYSGTNCTLETSDGLAWELQFHTPASYATKSSTHDEYDRMRDASTPLEERRRLFEEMTQVWNSISIPEGILVPGSLHESEQIRVLPAP
jgi:hypothetical protein